MSLLLISFKIILFADFGPSPGSLENCLINSSGNVLLGGDPVEIRNLSKAVRQKIAENDKLVISVKAHKASNYKDYIRVIDQLKQANATRISIAESD